MRTLVFIFLLGFISAASFGQTILWEEDFEGEANGAVTGTATGSLGGTWSVTTTPSGGAASFSRQSYNYDLWVIFCFTLTNVNIFQINQTGASEGVWQSNVINISGLEDVALEIDLGVSGGSSSDYVRCFYKIDGGPEIQFGELRGGNGVRELASTQSAILRGNTVQIVVRGLENTAGNVLCGSPHVMGFDNVRLIDITTLYSIANGNWNNGNTWSDSGYGGATCSPCTPSVDTKVYIGNNRTVNFNVEGEAAGLEVQNTGRLQWTANNIDLNIRRGASLDVRSGGILTLNGNGGAQIDFDEPYSNIINVEAGGNLSIGDIDLNGGTNLTLTGGGSLTVNDDFLLGSNGAVITNNMTGALNIMDQLNFEVNGIDFINNGAVMNVLGATGIVFTGDNNLLNNTGLLNATGATRSISFQSGATGNEVTNSGTLNGFNIFFDDDNNIINNTNTISLGGDILAGANDDNCVITNSGTLGFRSIGITNANLTINNSGTINQSGNFNNNTIDTGSSFNNLSGGTWNWSLSPNVPFDPDMSNVLNCSAAGNQFNYNGNGNQNIIPTTYYHLDMSNAGVKTAVGNFNLLGNWTRTGSATFTPGAFTVSLTGSATQTISAVGGETFAGLTINNTSATSPQIVFNNPVTVSGVLTMQDGNVNLNGNLFTLSSTAAGALVHGLTSASGWMYGAGFRRNRPASTTITVGTAHSIFPLGSSGDWRPFFVGQNSNGNSGGTMTVTHTNATTSTGVSFPEGVVVRHDANWSVATTGISAGPTFTIRSGGTNFGTIAAGAGGLADIRMCTTNGTVVGAHAASTGGPDYRVNRTGVSFAQLVANSYHVASVDLVNSPLPVELLYFNAKVNNDKIDLDWKTASELNNDFFTIERSVDAETFEEVLEKPGNGTTNKEHTYHVVDNNPIIGRSYYRLKQTDFDGTTSYSDLVSIEYEGPAFASLQAYPNPLPQSSKLTLQLSGVKQPAKVPVRIVSTQGQVVFEGVLQVDETGKAIHEIEFEEPLAAGLYIVKAGPSVFLTQKVAVVR